MDAAISGGVDTTVRLHHISTTLDEVSAKSQRRVEAQGSEQRILCAGVRQPRPARQVRRAQHSDRSGGVWRLGLDAAALGRALTRWPRPLRWPAAASWSRVRDGHKQQAPGGRHRGQAHPDIRPALAARRRGAAAAARVAAQVPNTHAALHAGRTRLCCIQRGGSRRARLLR